MNVKIGKKIRELRKNRHISQEVLAENLGVSFQAVSKWENGTAMPDVTLIPAIAFYFGVSTDELFDYNQLETEQRVMKICEASWECRDEDPKRAEEILREGLKQFPGNDILLNNLLYTMRSPERNAEVIELCKMLAGSTEDDEVWLDALRILAETYHDQGEQRLAEETVERLPEIYFTKLELAAELLEGEKAIHAAAQQMSLSIQQTVEMLLIMAKWERSRGGFRKAEIYTRIAAGVTEAYGREDCDIFGENETLRELRRMMEEGV